MSYGLLGADHLHGFVAGRDALTERVCFHAGCQGVVGQLRRVGESVCQGLQRPAVENTLAGRPRFSVYHILDLVMGEEVGPTGRLLLLSLVLTQQATGKQLLQSRKRLVFGEIGYPTQEFKVEPLSQDCSGRQHYEFVRSKLGQPGQYHISDAFGHKAQQCLALAHSRLELN